jgi:predicted metal-dependent RNase
MQVETCDGFSGHSDRKQLMDYFRRLHPKPKTVFVGHGDETKCIEFASTLRKKFGITALVPQNLETIRLA